MRNPLHRLLRFSAPLSPALCLSLALCAALATSLSAQESWTNVASPTAQNLWGVAARPASSATPAVFVAVGESGTILTSPDGLTWTARPSPTPRWLTSITYAADRFVATGDAGTLLTSPDGLIRGTLPQTLLVRAIGPGLAQFGVTSPLANPTLTFVDATGTPLATNDDWETNSNLTALRTATAAVGAFALSPNSRDAALLVTVPPGSYTALVTGVADTTRLALVEVYEVP